MPTKKSAKAKKTTKKAIKKPQRTRKAAREVRIRMYKQGLGDCFLITFPRRPKPFHMLVDCGALNSKHYGIKDMQNIVREIQSTLIDEASTGTRKPKRASIDVVAATHEHWDHISGFYDAHDIFKEFDVENVWVAWTEEPDNEAARLLKKEFKKKKQAVAMALERLPEEKKGDDRLGIYRKAISELFGFFGGFGAKGSGPGKTEQAWDNLLALGRNQYCNPKKRPLELQGVEGVRVYVLGPPEDPDYIRMKLSKKETYDEGRHGLSLSDSFLAAVGSDADVGVEAKERAFPFDQRYRIPPADVGKSSFADFFRKYYGSGEKDEGEWRRIDHEWLTMAGELALHLDSYTNNTCLAFAIELGEPGKGKVLLFPGDAQVGNWLSWEKLSWQVENSKGEKQTVKGHDLLARTVFYKVGHHGSHNATLRDKGLELMERDDLVTMIPVHRKTAEDQEWEFPYAPLWNRLREKARGRVLLADAKGFGDIEKEAGEALTPKEWKSFEKATKFELLYVEHRIPY